MKAVHIITGLNDGGAEALLYRFCENTVGEVDNIVVSFLGCGKYGAHLEELRVKCFFLEMNSIWKILQSFARLIRIIRREKPDVVQTWMFHADFLGGIAARLAGVKNVVWGVHNTTLIYGKSKLTTLLLARLNAALSYIIPMSIVYCADSARRVQEGIGFCKRKGVVIYNGYDCIKFAPDEEAGITVRQELGLDPNQLVIGSVGRFDPQKDYFNLIDAVALLKSELDHDFKVALVGSNLDEANNELVSYIASKELERNFVLVGRRQDIHSVLNAFDMFVLPSAYGEAFPNVLNEAMATGVPCIATNVGDSAMIIDTCGWVVPAQSSSALKEGILNAVAEYVAMDMSWDARKRKCSARIVDNFSFDRMVSEYIGTWG